MPHEIEYTSHFQKKYKKIIEKNSNLIKRTEKTLSMLQDNPMHKSLQSHKIKSKSGSVMSSYVTSDIRIIWTLDEDAQTILLHDIGGHEGTNSVY
jgi:mRNA-degrading endonuclease YafQ of YafQ-DinJ toxin-antitoxin module